MSCGSKKIRILFLSADRFPPFRVDVDVLFGTELTKRGHQIDWILQSDEPLDKDYHTRWRGGEVWVGCNKPGTSAWRRFLRHLDKIRNDMKMFHLTKTRQYEFIQVRDKCISAVIALLLARLRGIRFTYWLSYPFADSSIYNARTGAAKYPLFYYVRGKAFSFALYKFVMQKADHIFVQSEQMKRDIIAHGVPEHLMTAVPMGVQMEMLQEMKTSPETETDRSEKRVVYLGTLARVRRLDFLVRALALVKAEVPNVKLYFVGAGNDPEDEELLQSEAGRLGISDAIVFTGFLPMNKAWEYASSADVCVSPFFPTPILNSTSPTKLIEYMALGKAVVANDHPEQRLVIEESGAGLCTPYNEAIFAQAITTLIKNPERAKAMGRKGRSYVEQKRSYTIIANLVEKIYLDLCSTSETPP